MANLQIFTLTFSFKPDIVFISVVFNLEKLLMHTFVSYRKRLKPRLSFVFTTGLLDSNFFSLPQMGSSTCCILVLSTVLNVTSEGQDAVRIDSSCLFHSPHLFLFPDSCCFLVCLWLILPTFPAYHGSFH